MILDDLMEFLLALLHNRQQRSRFGHTRHLQHANDSGIIEIAKLLTISKRSLRYIAFELSLYL
jgi:hypothetical protein